MVGTSSAAPLFGPKGAFSTFLYDLKYDPSRGCSKPYKPYGSDRYAWDTYRQEGGRYVECMKAAATSDMDYASEIVADGYKKAVDDFISEVKRGY